MTAVGRSSAAAGLPQPWPDVAVDLATFRDPPREYGILPFWFLNGELEPDEMRFQLAELRDKGMPGIILHGRFGLETPYIGETYLERIALAVAEGERLGLDTWIYDEMNWPSGTADKRVLDERPDLAQRYIECLSFTVRGPWFTYLTGGDSRYLDFEKSRPVAAFAVGEDGRVIDLTPNLSFENVIPWEVPEGDWRLMYVVEKEADYYIDALDPEATAEFLRIGYEPYARVAGDAFGSPMRGFYTDEPAMHYFVTGGENPILPWTKNMFRRFHERTGYDLRPRLPDLFFDVSADSARVRFDFYNALTDFYSDAFYRQIHEWCGEHGVLFTGHLLYEEWLRKMVRVEGNIFRHYAHFDVIGVDHLYPVIGTREAPDQHVAMKVGSSAAHQRGSERLLCESFGGIFMDATMQRMKWITDWEYVLGVNLLNPHGFHYTLEGARKRDWPPSMFYQYPWWHYYGEFSRYVARLSSMLSGGRHVAKVAVLWPANAMFATYVPQTQTAVNARVEGDLNTLTDLLLRLHHDFDYLDEDTLANAEIADGAICVGEERYELLVLPPMTHVDLRTIARAEELVEAGGRLLGCVFLPDRAFDDEGIVDVRERVQALFGVDPAATQRDHAGTATPAVRAQGGAAFVEAAALDHGAAGEAVGAAISELIEPDVVISNPELFYLHRVKDDRDVYFVVNPTFEAQTAEITLSGESAVALWDPSTGEARALGGRAFTLELPPVGSAFVVSDDAAEEEADEPEPSETVTLDGDWEFELEDPNALVVARWHAAASDSDTPPEDGDWLELGHGAWAYQLPAEPREAWPIPVWYRVEFDARYVPRELDLVVDGFAGTDPRIFVNGEKVVVEARRSPFDSQMKALAVGPHVREGRNVLAIRLTLGGATDGLVDLVKLVGDFSVERADGRDAIAPPRTAIAPTSWTEQGYPFYSGRGTYRRAVELDAGQAAGRVFLEPAMADDVLEVVVNGRSAGVRLWEPYRVELTGLLQVGENTLELRVANTLVNLLEAVERPSGVAGPPNLLLCG